MMNQIKFYKFAIGGLILLNIIVLAFFVFTKPHHSRLTKHQGPSELKFASEAVKILDLDEDQISVFNKLAHEHDQDMKSIHAEQEKLLLPYFENLANPNDTINKGEILIQFQQLEGKKIEVTYHHFEEIKGLLNEEQKPDFEKFIRRFIDQFLLVKKRKPHHPK